MLFLVTVFYDLKKLKLILYFQINLPMNEKNSIQNYISNIEKELKRIWNRL